MKTVITKTQLDADYYTFKQEAAKYNVYKKNATDPQIKEMYRKLEDVAETSMCLVVALKNQHTK